jgi:hypothetical protein
MRQPSEDEIRAFAYLLYKQKQGMPWFTSGNTPEAAKGDWRAAETTLQQEVVWGPPDRYFFAGKNSGTC